MDKIKNYTINNQFTHIPVLTKESLEALNIKKNGIYIDSTFGLGGHTLEILKNIGEKGKLYAIDRDPYSVNIGKQIKDVRFEITHNTFSEIYNYAQEKNIIGKINGILFDLGVSSAQIENQKRGFSFIKNGPLDMRMNPHVGISASDWLFKSNINKITMVLKKFGEERFAKKIAFGIKKYQLKKKIKNTLELVNIIQKSIPKKNVFKHPARRTFQAIRIYINQELEELERGLELILKILKPGGRLVVISFHSLEDRIVKKFMIKHSQKAIIPYGIPITEKKINALKTCKLNIIKRILPSKKEIQINPRSRSAILRIAELKK